MDVMVRLEPPRAFAVAPEVILSGRTCSKARARTGLQLKSRPRDRLSPAAALHMEEMSVILEGRLERLEARMKVQKYRPRAR